MIPATYDVSFRLPGTHPIAVDELQRQVRDLGLDAYSDVSALGGTGYRGAIAAAFAGTGATLHAPFAGLPIGKMMQATKAAVEKNPHPNPSPCAQGEGLAGAKSAGRHGDV